MNKLNENTWPGNALAEVARQLGKKVDDELEAAICEYLKVDRLVDRRVLKGRLTLVREADNERSHYAVDGVPVLLLGPVELDMTGTIWTASRSVERVV